MVHKSFRMPAWALAFMQTFTIWQMGIMYYSTRSLTVGGSVLLPLTSEDTVLPIALGYLAGAVLAYFVPQYVGLWARLLSLALLGLLGAMFLPLSGGALALIFCLMMFFGVTFISVTATLSINLYSLKTALLDGVIGAILPAPFIAPLHYSGFELNFRSWLFFVAVIQLMIFIALTRIPSKTDMRFLPRQSDAPRHGRRVAPVMLTGTVFVYTIVCLCALFSNATAEGIPNGVSIFYLMSFVWGTLFFYLCYRRNISPFPLYTIFLGVTAIGFVLWLLPVSSVKFVSLLLQSACVPLSSLAWFIAAVLFERWHSRFIAPAAVLVALLTVLLHSALLEALRENAELLYAVYAVIALALLVIYFLCEPYFRRVWIDAYTKPPSARERQSSDEPLPLDTLSRRETEVMELAVQGYSNADIAKLLYISQNTLKDHIKRVYQKLGVHSRFELAARVNRADARNTEGL